MYDDIDELVKEVELFKTNMKDSGQVCNIFDEIINQLKATNINFSEKYIMYLDKMNEIKLDSEKQNNIIIGEYQDGIEKLKQKLDKTNEEFLTNCTKIIDQSKNQQEIFDKKMGTVLEKIKNFEIESVIQQIKLLNFRMLMIFGALGILFVIQILILIMK